MIILDATTKSLEVKLAGAVTSSELDVTCHTIDTLDSNMSVSDVVNTNVATTGTTAVTAMAAPASGHTRVVKSLTVYNKDSAAAVVKVQINSNSTIYVLCNPTLAAGETLTYSAED